MSDGTLLNEATVAGGDVVYDEDISLAAQGIALTIAAPSGGQSLPQGTITASQALAGIVPPSGIVYVTTSAGVETVSYTGITGAGFTGCQGGTGLMTNGQPITNAPLKMPASLLYTGPTAGVPPTRVSSANPLPTAITSALPAGTNALGSVSIADTIPATQSITVQDTATTGVPQFNGQVFQTGTPTAGSAAIFAVDGITSVSILVTGTWTGTIIWEVCRDPTQTTWTRGEFRQVGSGYTTTIQAFTANLIGDANVAGCTYVRLRAKNVGGFTGTAVVQVVETETMSGVFVVNAQSGDTRTIFDGANGGAITASGSIVLANLEKHASTIGIVIGGTVSGTTPSLTILMQEIDPVGQFTVMNSPGNSVTMGPYTTTSHTNYVEMIQNTGAVLVTWTVTGTLPSFSGVDLWVSTKEATFTYGQTQPGIQEPLSAVAMDTSSRTLVAGGAATGSALASTGNPVLVGGSDGTDVRNVTTDTSGRVVIAGGAATGSVLANTGNPVLVGGSDGTDVRNLSTDTSGRVVAVGGAAAGAAFSGNPVLVAGGDGTDARILGAVVDRASMTAGTQVGAPVVGQSSGTGRILRIDRMAHLGIGQPTLLFEDVIEGGTINPQWTQSVSGMTIVQAGGILTLNSAAATASGDYAILTSVKQIPMGRNQVPVGITFKQLVTQTTNAFNEFGFGAPAGVTAIPGNGVAYFRVSASGVAKGVVNYNGTETVSPTATLVATTYYLFHMWIEDGQARFQIESSAGTMLLDTQIALPIGSPAIGAGVTHSPIFTRVYTSGVAGAAPKTQIAQVQCWQWDWATSKPWQDQLASVGKMAGVSPTAFTPTASYSVSAAPATATLSGTANAYTTLGGEYVANGTAGGDTAYGLFGYVAPTPYTLNVTDVLVPPPVVTSALGGNATILEFTLAVATSGGGNPSTATYSQFIVLGVFTAAASAAAGTLFSGNPLAFSPRTPITVRPGETLLILVKSITGNASGVFRGAVAIHGTDE